MSEVEFYIWVGGLFANFYAFGAWTEQRAAAKERKRHRQQNFEMALRLGGATDADIERYRNVSATLSKKAKTP